MNGYGYHHCETDGCKNKAVGKALVYNEMGEWIGNKDLCKPCIQAIPSLLAVKREVIPTPPPKEEVEDEEEVEQVEEKKKAKPKKKSVPKRGRPKKVKPPEEAEGVEEGGEDEEAPEE